MRKRTRRTVRRGGYSLNSTPTGTRMRFLRLPTRLSMCFGERWTPWCNRRGNNVGLPAGAWVGALRKTRSPRADSGAFFVLRSCLSSGHRRDRESLFVGPRIAAIAFRASRAGAASAGGGLLLLLAGFLDERLAGEANLVALDGENLDEDLVAEFELVANITDAVLGDFADVQEAVGAREKLDEGAEFRKAHDLAQIRLADFRAGGDVADQLQAGVAPRSAGGG